MESAIQLALMAKAKKVFGKEDTFLSFPVSPLPYTKRQLDFFSERDADDLRQSKQNLQAFSTLVNLLPTDEAWLPTETRFLWDVYDEVLRADYASSTRTPEEEAAYQQARAYLGHEAKDGWEDSMKVKAYKQHKDAYLLAEQDYLAAKLTGECAKEKAGKRHWRDVAEPAHRAKLAALQAKWTIAGYKNEVEAAQGKVANLGARSPLLTCADWNSRFNRDLDSETGASDASAVYPSFFNPSNAVEEAAWHPFKLSEEEVKALLTEAPAEVRARLGIESTVLKVKSLSFEFSSAAISRSWFVPDVFRARFWRFAEAGKRISDGRKPPSGECPAYVSAIVFARRLAVEEKTAPPGQEGAESFAGFRFAVAANNRERSLGGGIWKYVGPPMTGWEALDNNPATVELVADGSALYQLHNTGRIWKFTGTPMTGWEELDNNPATRKILAAGGNLYQLHQNGLIWKYTGPPMTGWQALDNNSATVDIVADGTALYQLHNTGRIWKFTGTPLTGWEELDNNPATRKILAAGGNLYQMHKNGVIWKYVAPPMTGWQALDNNPATVDIIADDNALYQLHNTGRIWKFTGTPLTGWEELDNNPATRKILAAGGNLYQMHKNGVIWKYVGPPMTGWQALDNNPATVDIVAGGSALYQLHGSNEKHPEVVSRRSADIRVPTLTMGRARVVNNAVARPLRLQKLSERPLHHFQRMGFTRLASGPDACREGYVWREAFPGDHVCVTPETRAQVALDNSQADARRQPGGGPYGPDTCREGYVWREAGPDDHVCVTVETRAQTAHDNSQASIRCAEATGVAVADLPDQPTPPITPAAPPVPPLPVEDESIYILAFICKALPKCPNPDPTLQW